MKAEAVVIVLVSVFSLLQPVKRYLMISDENVHVNAIVITSFFIRKRSKLRRKRLRRRLPSLEE